MAFKFSGKDRTIRIYNLRADTREFIGAGDAYISESHRLTSISGKGKPRARCRVSSIPKLPAGVCH